MMWMWNWALLIACAQGGPTVCATLRATTPCWVMIAPITGLPPMPDQSGTPMPTYCPLDDRFAPVEPVKPAIRPASRARR